MLWRSVRAATSSSPLPETLAGISPCPGCAARAVTECCPRLGSKVTGPTNQPTCRQGVVDRRTRRTRGGRSASFQRLDPAIAVLGPV